MLLLLLQLNPSQDIWGSPVTSGAFPGVTSATGVRSTSDKPDSLRDAYESNGGFPTPPSPPRLEKEPPDLSGELSVAQTHLILSSLQPPSTCSCMCENKQLSIWRELNHYSHYLTPRYFRTVSYWYILASQGTYSNTIGSPQDFWTTVQDCGN